MDKAKEIILKELKKMRGKESSTTTQREMLNFGCALDYAIECIEQCESSGIDEGLFHKVLGDDFHVEHETRKKIWSFINK